MNCIELYYIVKLQFAVWNGLTAKRRTSKTVLALATIARDHHANHGNDEDSMTKTARKFNKAIAQHNRPSKFSH